MVDWQSQDDPTAIAVSTLIVVAAGVVFAWYGFSTAQAVTAVDAVVGVAIGVIALSAQTWVALKEATGDNPIPQSIPARLVIGAAAGIAGVAAIDGIPAITAVFGITLIPFGIASRLFLYQRFSRD